MSVRPRLQNTWKKLAILLYCQNVRKNLFGNVSLGLGFLFLCVLWGWFVACVFSVVSGFVVVFLFRIFSVFAWFCA